eukprot:Clim_evm27s240 gene=Clim_evmTU27s240
MSRTSLGKGRPQGTLAMQGDSVLDFIFVGKVFTEYRICRKEEVSCNSAVAAIASDGAAPCMFVERTLEYAGRITFNPVPATAHSRRLNRTAFLNYVKARVGSSQGALEYDAADATYNLANLLQIILLDEVRKDADRKNEFAFYLTVNIQRSGTDSTRQSTGLHKSLEALSFEEWDDGVLSDSMEPVTPMTPNLANPMISVIGADEEKAAAAKRKIAAAAIGAKDVAHSQSLLSRNSVSTASETDTIAPLPIGEAGSAAAKVSAAAPAQLEADKRQSSTQSARHHSAPVMPSPDVARSGKNVANGLSSSSEVPKRPMTPFGMALSEFHHTERTFLQGLDVLYTGYYIPFKENMGEKEADRLIGNVPEVRSLHRMILSGVAGILAVYENSSDVEKTVEAIACLFLDMRTKFSVQIDYITGQDQAFKARRTLLQKDESMRRFMQQCQRDSGSPFYVDDLMNSVFQRITRYPLLCEQLFKGCKHSGNVASQAILGLLTRFFQTIIRHINEIKRDQELQEIARFAYVLDERSRSAAKGLGNVLTGQVANLATQGLSTDYYGKILFEDELLCYLPDKQKFKPYHVIVFEDVVFIVTIDQVNPSVAKRIFLKDHCMRRISAQQLRLEKPDLYALCVRDGSKEKRLSGGRIAFSAIIVPLLDSASAAGLRDALRTAVACGRNRSFLDAEDATKGHQLATYTFPPLMVCDVCDREMLGGNGQGVRCRRCLLQCHTSCFAAVHGDTATTRIDLNCDSTEVLVSRERKAQAIQGMHFLNADTAALLHSVRMAQLHAAEDSHAYRQYRSNSTGEAIQARQNLQQISSVLRPGDLHATNCATSEWQLDDAAVEGTKVEKSLKSVKKWIKYGGKVRRSHSSENLDQLLRFSVNSGNQSFFSGPSANDRQDSGTNSGNSSPKVGRRRQFTISFGSKIGMP